MKVTLELNVQTKEEMNEELKKFLNISEEETSVEDMYPSTAPQTETKSQDDNLVSQKEEEAVEEEQEAVEEVKEEKPKKGKKKTKEVIEEVPPMQQPAGLAKSIPQAPPTQAPIQPGTKPTYSLTEFKNSFQQIIMTLLTTKVIDQTFLEQATSHYQVDFIFQVSNDAAKLNDFYNQLCNLGMILRKSEY